MFCNFWSWQQRERCGTGTCKELARWMNNDILWFPPRKDKKEISLTYFANSPSSSSTHSSSSISNWSSSKLRCHDRASMILECCHFDKREPKLWLILFPKVIIDRSWQDRCDVSLLTEFEKSRFKVKIAGLSAATTTHCTIMMWGIGIKYLLTAQLVQ